MSTDIEIASRALVSIGAGSLQSFSEGTTDAEVAASLYPIVRDDLLASHPWNFATVQHDLNRLVDAPIGDYDYQFQLPADTIRVVAAKDGSGKTIRNFRIQETKLLCNSENVVIVFIYRPDESIFPPHFQMALIKRLAAEFTIPLTESTTRAEMLFTLADDTLRKAKTTDSQQDTPQAFTDFPLYSARGGRGSTIEPDYDV